MNSARAHQLADLYQSRIQAAIDQAMRVDGIDEPESMVAMIGVLSTILAAFVVTAKTDLTNQEDQSMQATDLKRRICGVIAEEARLPP